MSRPQQITVLGATGSIGLSTLDVIARHPDRYQAFALSGFTRLSELFALCVRHLPEYAVVPEAGAARNLQDDLRAAGLSTQVLVGEEGLCQVAAAPEVDAVMAAIVGAAGLRPTLAAVEAGKKILLANKEALVMSGALFMQAVRKSGSVLLPIDSEHNAIFQCMPQDFARGLSNVGVRRILLTASGGPFRQTPMAELAHVSPDQACAHPNWSMGRKISVDSASMMNKGLELIEACWLFDAKPSQVEVVIHPQSVIHSLVDYVDGSVLAQLGNPDMRTPIANALAWPERIDSGVAPLDLFAVARLDFEAPDEERFPCLRLARQAAEAGNSAPAMLNAANEVAVAAFLDGRVRYLEIASIIEEVLNLEPVVALDNLDAVFAADATARTLAGQWLSRNGR
ncbi:1-deoxy-D-xylulose-5-phosphate reductoisomerase [Pseudomonas fluorescens]|uniref:1-deoxy-D-xylulose 5-phosphate reductoisomerase n=1 Tax=Pseudomonas fluorescens (strain Pf0-1) TaxID=205922 RepID=DXR_PSEPF|nr:1-deoxy-D-xylulose-5-phosphate reductoisomerase [Pseudomonas fluorescens]Q3KHA6.1 RecName: Full=1-deoxy-D-xylulose 5-phosphate reductoisomerase; Short=DXP reductoisomerase; AltName: Full=1-deoxyxylulose-5-phosphate reductoisomerase; AltName: Full=2-C-methyl-D-erythritol 4-phosphate synthase [Pseudomonas fluorescens Pf0-1]ABA72850.1 1-deoxy-D-xylulose 5-phosphate reductoisomerase [Pseudomonas fluorescens Pf0-1]MBY9022944.1 1-deoxy-D-xylulose-5-phosphate reductoisomerase [Pseudomonas fluorescen